MRRGRFRGRAFFSIRIMPLAVCLLIFVPLAGLAAGSQSGGSHLSPLLGVHSHLTRADGEDSEFRKREASFQAINEIGFAYVRTGIVWKYVQPSPGVWRWDEIDSVVRLAKSRGVRILAVVHGPPAWASPASRHTKEWEKFLTAAVNRYGDTVKSWEIWNELNVAKFWPKDAPLSGYVDILKRSQRIIKAKHPDAKVVLAGMANNERAFDTWRELISLGALNYCDAVGFHPYKLTGQEILPVYRDLRGMMTKFAGGDKPIWVTEYGWSAPPPGVKAKEEGRKKKVTDYPGQADRILKTYLAHAAAGGGPFIIYELRDDRNGKFMGIIEKDFNRKPAALALAWIIRKLGPSFSVVSSKVSGDGMIVDLKTSGGAGYFVTWGRAGYAEMKSEMASGRAFTPEMYVNEPPESIMAKLKSGDRAVNERVIFWHAK